MKQDEAVRKALESLPTPSPEEDAEYEQMGRDGVTPAPDGQVWICGACGKTSPTKYGFDADEKNVAEAGWDESCMLNAVLCLTSSIMRNKQGRIVYADPVPSELPSEGGSK